MSSQDQEKISLNLFETLAESTDDFVTSMSSLRELMKKKPNLDIRKILDRKDEMGSLLHQATSDLDEVAVKLLLGHGANPNLLNENGESPLEILMENVNYNIMMWLLRSGADPNHQSSEGWTALHHAAQSDDMSALTMLMMAGGDPYILNSNSQSALDVTESNEVIESILDFDFIWYESKLNEVNMNFQDALGCLPNKRALTLLAQVNHVDYEDIARLFHTQIAEALSMKASWENTKGWSLSTALSAWAGFMRMEVVFDPFHRFHRKSRGKLLA